MNLPRLLPRPKASVEKPCAAEDESASSVASVHSELTTAAITVSQSCVRLRNCWNCSCERNLMSYQLSGFFWFWFRGKYTSTSPLELLKKFGRRRKVCLATFSFDECARKHWHTYLLKACGCFFLFFINSKRVPFEAGLLLVVVGFLFFVFCLVGLRKRRSD